MSITYALSMLVQSYTPMTHTHMCQPLQIVWAKGLWKIISSLVWQFLRPRSIDNRYCSSFYQYIFKTTLFAFINLVLNKMTGINPLDATFHLIYVMTFLVRHIDCTFYVPNLRSVIIYLANFFFVNTCARFSAEIWIWVWLDFI